MAKNKLSNIPNGNASDVFDIEIKDFQSIRHAKLNLVNGINIITGRTNVGKTAIIRAIDTAIFNLGDDSMIRSGKRYYGIGIYNGRHKVMFVRDGVGKNEKSSYQIDDGNIIKKVGRSQLEEIGKDFNIRDVKMQNGVKMKLNFWYQNDKPFLMDKSAGQLYEFLSLSSCEKYEKVLKVMNKDRKSLESDIGKLTTEIDTYKVITAKKEEFIENNKGFDELYNHIIINDRKAKRISNIQETIKKLKEMMDKIHNISVNLFGVENKLNKCNYNKLEKTYKAYIEKEKKISDMRKDIKGIIENREIINKDEIQLDNISKQCNDSDSVVKGMNNSINTLIDRISKTVPVYYDLRKVKDSKDRIEKVQKEFISIDTGNIDIDGLKYEVINTGKKVKENHNLKDIVNKLKVEYNKIQEKSNTIDKLNDSIKDNENELEELKMNVGYCPFCETVFTKGEKHNHDND